VEKAATPSGLISVSSVTLDPDETLAELDADVRRSSARAAQMPAFEAAVAAARGTARSRAGDILVEVDANGRVTSLRLTEQALRRGAPSLERDLLSTIRSAERDVRAHTLAAVADLLGADDPLLAQLADHDLTTLPGAPR
jgi:hypothetical protein